MSIILGIGLSLISIILVVILKVAKLFRLTIPVLYIAIVLMFFKGWYIANTLLANIILGVIVGMITISWIITICKKISKRNIKRRREGLDLIINSKPMEVYKIKRNEQE